MEGLFPVCSFAFTFCQQHQTIVTGVYIASWLSSSAWNQLWSSVDCGQKWKNRFHNSVFCTFRASMKRLSRCRELTTPGLLTIFHSEGPHNGCFTISTNALWVKTIIDQKTLINKCYNIAVLTSLSKLKSKVTACLEVWKTNILRDCGYWVATSWDAPVVVKAQQQPKNFERKKRYFHPMFRRFGCKP